MSNKGVQKSRDFRRISCFANDTRQGHSYYEMQIENGIKLFNDLDYCHAII